MTLEFAGRNGAGYFAFDDVSVEPRAASGVPDTGPHLDAVAARYDGYVGLKFFVRREA